MAELNRSPLGGPVKRSSVTLTSKSCERNNLEHAPSYKNIVGAGFSVAYVRPNWTLPA